MAEELNLLLKETSLSVASSWSTVRCHHCRPEWTRE